MRWSQLYSASLRAGIVLVLSIVVSGCATSSFRQVDTLRKPQGQTATVLMPLDVHLYELTAAGLQEPKADWTELAKGHLTAAFAAEQTSLGLQLKPLDEASVDSAASDRLLQVQRLHSVVGQAILTHQYVPVLALPSKGGKFDWTLGPEVKALKEATGADYALFVFVNDGYSSGGRVALIVAGAMLGIGIPGATQLGFASLVDLETGDVVWFNRLLRNVGDLRTAEPARETAKTLLTNFPR
jgi:hypothetical protein